MSNSQVITLRVPADLKKRVTKIANEQGVSLNQFVMYALTEKVTTLETERYLADVWRGKTEAEIFSEFDVVMAKVGANNDLPEWDRI